MGRELPWSARCWSRVLLLGALAQRVRRAAILFDRGFAAVGFVDIQEVTRSPVQGPEASAKCSAVGRALAALGGSRSTRRTPALARSDLFPRFFKNRALGAAFASLGAVRRGSCFLGFEWLVVVGVRERRNITGRDSTLAAGWHGDLGGRSRSSAT